MLVEKYENHGNPDTAISADLLRKKILMEFNFIILSLIKSNTQRELGDLKIGLTPEQIERFITDPNSTQFHKVQWHQYGILGHTLAVVQQIKKLLIQIESQQPDIFAYFLTRLSGSKYTKADLFQIAALAHDLGKWAGCFVGANGKFSQTQHEVVSGQVVRGNFPINNPFHSLLVDSGLSKSEIEYIATVAELHFELGILRRHAYDDSDSGYSPEWVRSEHFRSSFLSVINSGKCKNYQLEILLFFLADSQGKISSTLQNFIMQSLPAEYTQDDINQQKMSVDQKLASLRLDSNLSKAVLQYPINVLVYKKGLEIITETL